VTGIEPKKPDPKKLGDFLVVSKGAISNAVEKQISTYASSGQLKPIGEILLEQGIINKDELDNSLRNQRIARLAGCPLFASLTKTELSALSKYFTEVNVGPSEQFIMQGEEDLSMYVIGSGLVEVYRVDNAGNEFPIAQVGEGEPIGEMGYFSGGRRNASVRAIHPTILLKANYEDLTHYFENVPRVAMAFTQVIEYRRKELEKITSNNE
jgi:hypothetical protein